MSLEAALDWREVPWPSFRVQPFEAPGVGGGWWWGGGWGVGGGGGGWGLFSGGTHSKVGWFMFSAYFRVTLNNKLGHPNGHLFLGHPPRQKTFSVFLVAPV